MAKPKYTPSSDVITAKAKINRSYELLEQEINGLDNFVRKVKDSVNSLRTSYDTDTGIEVKKALHEKIRLIEYSIRRIQQIKNQMGGKPHITPEKGHYYNETKCY